MKLADTAPAFCAACYGQKPDERHVDFEAAFDGHVVKPAGDGYDAVAVDDLVLCEPCLRAAFELLPDLEAAGREEALRERVRELERAVDRSENARARMREALNARGEAEAAVAKARPSARKRVKA